MERKLKEFKSRRRREMLLNKPKEFIRNLISKVSWKENVPFNGSPVSETLLPSGLKNSPVSDEDEASILSIASDDVSFSLKPKSWIDVLIKLLYFALWIITYLVAVHFEFGFVYLTLSGLLFIYYNTRTGPKKEGEISAYSVFNPGCEAIQGTLKAEQLEREFNLIRH